MNPFRSHASKNTWLVPVSVLSLVVGFLTSVAWITKDTRNQRWSTLAADQQARMGAVSIDLQEEYQKVMDEVTKLRAENTRLQNAVAGYNNASGELNQSLQQLKIFAALTEAEGPGITITLRDSKPKDDFVSDANIIHDYDVLKAVNELWNAGAEAISVNNHRVGPSTNIRCAGTTILIDSVKIATPILIRAIGDPDTLYGAMNLPGGALQEIRSVDPGMVQIDSVKKHRLPAYAGATTRTFLKVPTGKP